MAQNHNFLLTFNKNLVMDTFCYRNHQNVSIFFKAHSLMIIKVIQNQVLPK